jgi:hypothetical protein
VKMPADFIFSIIIPYQEVRDCRLSALIGHF